MGKKYLIDTNIIIYYLNNEIPEHKLAFIESVFLNFFNISTITRIELLGWHKINTNLKQQISNFLSNAIIHYFNYEIEKLTIDIKQSQKIKITDAIIAGTAIYNDLILITRNINDFKSINNIKLLNPFEI